MEEKKVFCIEFGVGGGVNDIREDFIIAEDKSEAESIALQNAEHLFFETWEETLCSCKEDLDEEEDLSNDFQCQCVDSWITFNVIEITEENINNFTDKQIEEYNKLKNEL
jgi:hypothetical protein